MKRLHNDFSQKETAEEIEKQYSDSGRLSFMKLMEYLPAMFLTSLSNLLLVSVDGMVVGNLIGEEALSSVNVFYPVSIMTGAFSLLASCGISTCLSLSAASNDRKKILRAKAASRAVMIALTVIMSIVQIPLAALTIRSYGLSDTVNAMTWQYAIGMMIASPFGLVSTVGTYQLQIVGKMKTISVLSIVEGTVNVILDLLFVGAFHMGIAGAGYGTAGANVIRCVATVIILAKTTDLYRCEGEKAHASEVKDILRSGLPDAANAVLLALQGYFMMKILIYAFGDSGGTIRGVCIFCFNLSRVLVRSILGSMRPLTGLMCGSNNLQGMRSLMRQGILVALLLTIGLTVIIFLTPAFFFRIHGVDPIPPEGILSLRLYALYFPLDAVNAVFGMFLIFRKDTTFCTVMSVCRNVARPILAFLLNTFFAAPCLWLSYFLAEAVIYVLNQIRYSRHGAVRQAGNDETRTLYLSVRPGEAIEASRMIRRYADHYGYPSKLAYRLSLTMEEMVAYATTISGKKDVDTQLVVSLSKDHAEFRMIDNGVRTALDEDHEMHKIITDNYELVKKMATSVEYQYILNMNYTTLSFSL